MTRPGSVAVILACALLAAGCASTSSHPAVDPAAAPAAPLSLTTALTARGVTWAAVPMGAASGPDLFWQLLIRPPGSSRWSLVTPPGVPTNGAILLASPGGPALTAGIRPALALRFSPLTTTADSGHTWTSGQPLTGLAGVPDALASAPGGQLIALTQDGHVSLATSAGTAWTPLTSQRSLAATPAAASCSLTKLTAVAYSPAGTALLGGNCARPGVAGIFARTHGAWHTAALPVPASLSRQPVRVLRLTMTGDRDTALLQAGTGAAATLIAAWTGADGASWTLSPPLGLASSPVVSASFSTSGAVAVVLSGNRGQTITGPAARWQRLPPLPTGRTVTLALPAAGGTDALAATGSTLTAWHLAPGAATWIRTQDTKVPIQYGSSN